MAYQRTEMSRPTKSLAAFCRLAENGLRFLDVGITRTSHVLLCLEIHQR